jgi:cobalt-zinc-cadmium resistance protein CzcA
MPTINAVKAEIDHINDSGILPPGVHLERIYDRSDLIKVTTRTVMENLVVGILLIFFLQWAWQSAQRVDRCRDDPLRARLCGADPHHSGESANLLSVGALDFGLVVDATVIMVENIFRHMAERSHHVEKRRTGITLSPAVFPRCFMHRVK